MARLYLSQNTQIKPKDCPRSAKMTIIMVFYIFCILTPIITILRMYLLNNIMQTPPKFRKNRIRLSCPISDMNVLHIIKT